MNASLEYSYTLNNPRILSIDNHEDNEKKQDIDDPVIPDPKHEIDNRHQKKFATAMLSVGLSFAAFFFAILIMNWLKLKYRRGKQSKKMAKLSNKVSMLYNPEITVPTSNISHFDFEDIEDIEIMSRKTKSVMYSDTEDDENESYFIPSFNTLKPTPLSIPLVSKSYASNGMIYSKPKHFRSHTVI